MEKKEGEAKRASKVKPKEPKKPKAPKEPKEEGKVRAGSPPRRSQWSGEKRPVKKPSEEGPKPAWDDRFYVNEVKLKPRKASGLEEEKPVKQEEGSRKLRSPGASRRTGDKAPQESKSKGTSAREGQRSQRSACTDGGGEGRPVSALTSACGTLCR
ncbi:unnamed protein product [Effrenium voratum]|uniref:Uncharacterized protein n=1 Tax=Effrenium voratum TaxID=2562239 RepID=A0AA36JCJ8_9DINO|nr:unnamed protein product [Effrenium voratum]